MINKTTEKRLRRQAQRIGLHLVKERKSNYANIEPGWLIVDTSTNGVVCGGDFALTLHQVEDYLHQAA